MRDLTYSDYSEGHPWFYVLGGTPMRLKDIKAYVNETKGTGYLDREIEAVDARAEPKRSEDIKAMRASIRTDLAKDIRRYRECLRELATHRASYDETGEIKCDDIHVSLGLKFSHLLNGFGNLRALDALAVQKDLFDLL